MLRGYNSTAQLHAHAERPKGKRIFTLLSRINFRHFIRLTQRGVGKVQPAPQTLLSAGCRRQPPTTGGKRSLLEGLRSSKPPACPIPQELRRARPNSTPSRNAIATQGSQGRSFSRSSNTPRTIDSGL